MALPLASESCYLAAMYASSWFLMLSELLLLLTRPLPIPTLKGATLEVILRSIEMAELMEDVYDACK